ncbi:MAG: hypothetical protein KDA47_25120, partial [Planctomycetales bacterium]|nr:hypothetical protein [Planctomycetales bacterium]
MGEIDFADHRHGSDHPNCGMLRIRLSSLARGAESNRQLFAWLPADACVTGGLDGLANRSALGNDDGRRRDASWRWLFAHEIAHNFVGSNYHVTRPLEANEVGFDVLHVDPWRREAIAADSADLPLYDLMRGRARAPRASDRQRWIGRQTFEKLFYALSRRPPLAGGAPGAGHMSGKSGDPALLEQFTRTPAMGADGMTVLSWSGAADRFDLHYSHDDQATWRHLAFSSRTRLTIDEGLLAGGERCFYRLTAWSVDGIICESRQVGPFRVLTRPRARIIVPDGSSAYRAGGSAVLLAYGIAIPADADFHWRLNGELVGIGQKAVARRLQAGVHRLELTV